MLSNKTSQDATSTPKRRRLGPGRILPTKDQLNRDFPSTHSPIDFKKPYSNPKSSPQRSESPFIPCNQVEFLSDSNNSSSAADIPCSPGVLNRSIIKEIENWDSLALSSNKIDKLCIKELTNMSVIEELDEVSDDMFRSKLDQSNYLNVNNQSKFGNEFVENVEQSFNEINESICQLMDSKKCNQSLLFESRDSFLLDVKENGITLDNNNIDNKQYSKPKTIDHLESKSEGFYGLPIVTKGLFKTYRNIEKFYDWQEECLNLDAVKERRNLIYSLPTSGGKTLVAEVLMLREVLVNKKNALFILPFVAIVQEKILALSPFAVQLDFLVEEYAGGKGHIPPKKRRKKNSIYIATIEKALALIRSLIELDRLNEIGLIVVDELHLIGEEGRGGTLETLLTTVLFTNQAIQIVGMSATIGNLSDVAQFLRASVFERQFRPVELREYVKLGDMLHRIQTTASGDIEITPHRQLNYDYSPEAARLDPDRLAGLVWEGGLATSCLIFCPTKKNCENVAALLCNLITPEMKVHRVKERVELYSALRGEGASAELCRAARCGLAYHHAGLAADERALLEHAFRSGVLSAICCTSTLAAGVNLPASRVIVRAPRLGRRLLAAAAYRQMAGRAGRAGHADIGECILVCSAAEWAAVRAVLARGVAAARSSVAPDALALSALALRLARTGLQLRALMDVTFLAVAGTDRGPVNIKEVCDEAIVSLLRSGAIELESNVATSDTSALAAADCAVYNDTGLRVSTLGRAAIKGCMDLPTAKQLLSDIRASSRGLVLMGSLHLLYIVTPHDAAGLKPDYRHYYSLYSNLDEEGLQTARTLGITEVTAVRMITGKPVTSVPESVVRRFYVALMLRDLWRQLPFAAVADKYMVSRGIVQSIMTSSSAFSSSAHKFSEELSHLWAHAALFGTLADKLQHCAAPELQTLMELPAVRKTRALQLARAGLGRVEAVARAEPARLSAAIPHLSLAAATALVSAARMMLIEKVENLRAEAEDVMEELKV